MKNFVAYYRVSTGGQGRSGLGIEAQKRSVQAYLEQVSGSLIGEYTEVETGKKAHNRPKLAEALAHCRKRKATLILATLDRLARKVHFISGLMESKIAFVCADMPNAGAFELHIRAAVAEEEGRKISERTKAALASLKARGVRLGSPKLEAINAPRRAAADDFALKLAPTIAALKKEGYTTYQSIADVLNDRKIPTVRGGKWHLRTVYLLIKRMERLSA